MTIFSGGTFGPPPALPPVPPALLLVDADIPEFPLLLPTTPNASVAVLPSVVSMSVSLSVADLALGFGLGHGLFLSNAAAAATLAEREWFFALLPTPLPLFELLSVRSGVLRFELLPALLPLVLAAPVLDADAAPEDDVLRASLSFAPMFDSAVDVVAGASELFDDESGGSLRVFLRFTSSVDAAEVVDELFVPPPLVLFEVAAELVAPSALPDVVPDERIPAAFSSPVSTSEKGRFCAVDAVLAALLLSSALSDLSPALSVILLLAIPAVALLAASLL